jgi:RNA 2',3'-cyclic 3'-phosphodiesterase
MRAFLALELGETARSTLADLQAELARTLDGWRWTRREALHLTLRFLGEIDERAELAARERFAAAARTIAAFDAVTRELGCFPDARRPRVLWIGVREIDGEPRLGRLAEALERAAQASGLAPERRPFEGHLTLARAPRGGRPSAPAERAGRAVPIPVTEVVLFESRLGPTGARYTARARFPLGDAPGRS